MCCTRVNGTQWGCACSAGCSYSSYYCCCEYDHPYPILSHLNNRVALSDISDNLAFCLGLYSPPSVLCSSLICPTAYSLLSSHTITKTTLPQLWLSPPYSSLRTLVSLSIFTAYDNLSLITHFRSYRSTRETLRSPAYRGAQESTSTSTDALDTRLRLTKPTTGLLDWLSSVSSSSSSPTQAVQSRKEETRLDILNTPRARTIRKIFFIWLKINICTIVVAWLLIWLSSSSPHVGDDEKQSMGIVGKATNVLEIIVSLGWMTLLELDESVPIELEELRKKRYAFKGA